MAETGSIISKQQRLASSKVQENPQNPSKFYNQFLYKIVIVSIFLLVLPFFPSQAPDFINQNFHTTSWEILQLVFVGIAVSYGLFSKRNDETEKDLHSSKFDNAQSYVSGLLQVSSVFDDETDSPSSTYENKVQTWNSQYYRGEPPMVTVAPENPVLDQEKKTTHVGEKTLLLPVRSLKSRVPYPDESSVKGVSLDRSNSNLGSKQFSRSSTTSRTGELGGASTPPPPKIEENVVLRSPIPWRSRSGRLELKEDMENPFYTLPPSMEEANKSNKIESHTFSSQSFRNSIPKSNSPPKNLSPTPSISSDFQSQKVEDLVRRKSFRKSTLPIPPPPPPPPPFFHKSRLSSSTSSDKNDEMFPRKDLKRSVRSVPLKLSGNSPENLKNSSKTEGPEWWTRTSSDASIMNKYVENRDEEMKWAAKGEGSDDNFVNVMEEKRVRDLETTFIKNRGYPDRIIRENPSFMPNQTFTEFQEENKQNFAEDVLVETEDEDSETDDDGDDYDDDELEELSGYANQVVTHNGASDGGPDVDKKADEFIAKFREQIRLQRIASARKSTGQVQKNTIR
ncbi:hypothetical protein DCAR_0209623 [Daucus carota subsp. sativus]|uniref:Uncharacterized protein n=1 Tax=Daucus carota subsp. sativus TaxID=79200 RepID=A0AAF0WIP8_DAUCS|nr:PREDICTED: uncharacterized protein LOC108207883 [Daucus carota subsp. sativus]WOG90379.1 hypothetical protein DCAR_0209623 [Daucus carota subsp. sativus]